MDWNEIILFFKHGGIMMYPLLLCSLICVYAFARLLELLRYSKLAPAMIGGKSLIKDWRIFDGELPQKSVAVSAFQGCRRRVDPWLETLDLITMIAPLLGLTGTVLGIIHLFTSAAESKITLSTATFTGGIAEVLVTTLSGLCIAICGSVFSSVMSYRANSIFARIGAELENLYHSEESETNLG